MRDGASSRRLLDDAIARGLGRCAAWCGQPVAWLPMDIGNFPCYSVCGKCTRKVTLTHATRRRAASNERRLQPGSPRPRGVGVAAGGWVFSLRRRDQDGVATMLLEHRGKRPRVHDSAWIAPNAVVCGDVTIGAESRVLFGAVVTAEGGPVAVGSHCIIMETAVIRGTGKPPTNFGNHSMIRGGHSLIPARRDGTDRRASPSVPQA